MAWENQYMSADVDKNSLMIGEAEKLGKAVQQALSPIPYPTNSWVLAYDRTGGRVQALSEISWDRDKLNNVMADSPFSASVDVDKETNLVRISPFDDAHANLVWYIIPADTVHKLLHDRDGKGKTCLDLTDIQLTQEQLATVSPEIANISPTT